MTRPVVVLDSDKCSLEAAERLSELGYDPVMLGEVDAIRIVPTQEDRRFTAAVAATGGLLAGEPNDSSYDSASVAKRAVAMADALLKELAK